MEGGNVEWKDIPGLPGYQASGDGEIRSARRPGSTGGVLATQIDKGGYKRVTPSVGGKQVTRRVHTLVALAFYGHRPDGMEVRHLNGIKLDCRASNLKYGTRSENKHDRASHGTDHELNKTHCKRAHEFSPENTRAYRGQRRCRTCAREDQAAHRARKLSGENQ